MEKNTLVYGALIFILICLAAGSIVRYEVVKDRNAPDVQLITDFSTCLSSEGGLDVTGTICTAASGETYLKPGATLPSPEEATSTTGTTTPPAPSTPLSLNSDTTFTLNKSKTLPNGALITLTAIHDSRCKPDVQCIWQGEFSTDWQIVNGGNTETLTLGTERNKTETRGEYIYSLITATTTSAVLRVTKYTPPVSGKGTVTGSVTVGPICPVESLDHPCDVPPETYTSRSVVVYKAETNTELETHPLSATGSFTFSLQAGNYGLQIRPAGIGSGEIKRVTVTTAGTSTVHFDIDTGIR